MGRLPAFSNSGVDPGYSVTYLHSLYSAPARMRCISSSSAGFITAVYTHCRPLLNASFNNCDQVILNKLPVFNNCVDAVNVRPHPPTHPLSNMQKVDEKMASLSKDTNEFTLESVVCGHHVYKCLWTPHIGDQLTLHHSCSTKKTILVIVEL